MFEPCPETKMTKRARKLGVSGMEIYFVFGTKLETVTRENLFMYFSASAGPAAHSAQRPFHWQL
jgi:hypothetical protein